MEADEKDLVGAVKVYLEDSRIGLRELHRKSRGGVPVCAAYTAIIDDMLKVIYGIKEKSLGFNSHAALVAIGGYGRGELNIRSDIDLLLMHRGAVTPALKEFTEAILYVLYDTGLDLGFVMRTPEECVDLARGDLNTLTSLLETRFLIGHAATHKELLRQIKTKLFTKKRVNKFIDEKIEESEMRYAKYGGSVFILEPNIKEGEGGLRDLHTARWILMARDGIQDKPFSMSLVSKRDKEALERGLAFLLWIRNELHFNSSRKTDQLTFDEQVRIAAELGFKDTRKALAVESFMLEYYAHTSEIHNAYELIVSRRQYECRKKAPLWPRRKKRLDDSFYVLRGWLTLYENRPLSPEILTKAYEYIALHNLDLDQRTKDIFISYIHSLEDFPISRETAESFFAILRAEAPYKALSAMHSIGLLDKLIPEFRDIRHRVQHDLYHIYTVDIHSLFAVRELGHLGDKYKDELPLLSSIYNNLHDRAPIILAVLLHDIGKSVGKGHAEAGSCMAGKITERLHGGPELKELIEFLVKNHLQIANTALYRDMHSRQLIIDFARIVGTRERLDALYLLTFADVKAVGPDVWSKWKGVLFDELYIKVGDVIDTGAFELEKAEEIVLRKKADVRGLLAQNPAMEGGGSTGAGAFLELLPDRYFLANEGPVILEHLKALMGYDLKMSHIMRVIQDSKGAYTCLIICTLDRQGLFAMLSGVMAANNIEILGAQITTLKNGLVLDILQVVNARGRPVSEQTILKKIDKGLGEVISGSVKIGKLFRRRSSILDKKSKTPVITRINIDNTISDSMSIIDIHTENKLGLLFDITKALAELGLYINIARISTKGSEATDIFYVKDIFGQKVYGEEKLEKIRRTIYESIMGKSGDKEKKQKAVKDGVLHDK